MKKPFFAKQFDISHFLFLQKIYSTKSGMDRKSFCLRKFEFWAYFGPEQFRIKMNPICTTQKIIGNFFWVVHIGIILILNCSGPKSNFLGQNDFYPFGFWWNKFAEKKTAEAQKCLQFFFKISPKAKWNTCRIKTLMV